MVGYMRRSKKEIRKLPRKERKAAKKEYKEQRFSDPYNIEEMSDEDFLNNYNKLRLKAWFRTGGGFVFLILVILALVLCWDYMV